jgi:hypothetical protein
MLPWRWMGCTFLQGMYRSQAGPSGLGTDQEGKPCTGWTQRQSNIQLRMQCKRLDLNHY